MLTTRSFAVLPLLNENCLYPSARLPPFLCIVASPDDDQAEHLAAELKPTAILKWAVVKDYIGSVADIITTKQKSVY
jgi:hypothetical protein